MNPDIVQLYGPGMSFYRSEITPPRCKPKTEESSLRKYCVALRELTTTNKLLESRVRHLCSQSLELNHDITRLNHHMTAFNGDLLATWQADILTRLVEVIYEKHGWKMPGGLLVGDHDDLDRDVLSGTYAMAARKVKKETVTEKTVGLSEKHYLALRRYDAVVHLRSTNPFRTECNFARWLASKKSTRPKMFRFWEELFPVCYNRTVQESSEMF